jgi:hypothetical protein
MQVMIDLGDEQEISSVGGSFLQDVRSWIWMPSTFEVYVSADGVQFNQGAMVRNQVATDNYDSQETADMEVQFSTPIKGRYIMITARNAGPVPDWHPGAGGKSWVFCDEVWFK